MRSKPIGGIMATRHEIRLRLSDAKWDWLNQKSMQMGYRSPNRVIVASINKGIFEDLVLKGRFARNNTKQLKAAFNAVNNKRR